MVTMRIRSWCPCTSAISGLTLDEEGRSVRASTID